MKKILILSFFVLAACKTFAQTITVNADTVLNGNIEKNCPGGFAAFNGYIKKATHYPAVAREASIQGVCYVEFVIEPNGRVGNICTLLPCGSGIDEEVARVIKPTGNWIPATLDGKPVRTFCRAAVKFALRMEGGEMVGVIEAKDIN